MVFEVFKILEIVVYIYLGFKFIKKISFFLLWFKFGYVSKFFFSCDKIFGRWNLGKERFNLGNYLRGYSCDRYILVGFRR